MTQQTQKQLGAFVSVILKNKLLKPDQITVWDINPEVKNGLNELGIKNVVIKDTLLNTNIANDSFVAETKKRIFKFYYRLPR